MNLTDLITSLIFLFQNCGLSFSNILSQYYPQLSYTEDENRIYINYYSYSSIWVAKNRQGNFLNALEFQIGCILQEYPIQIWGFRRPYFNQNFGILVKPIFQNFDKNIEPFNYYQYSIYNRNIMPYVFSLSTEDSENNLGVFNNKIVTKNYSHLRPLLFPLSCNNCGNFMYGGLEPFCPKCGTINLTHSSNANFLKFYFEKSLEIQIGGGN